MLEVAKHQADEGVRRLLRAVSHQQRFPSPRDEHRDEHRNNHKRGDAHVAPPAGSALLTFLEPMVEGQVLQPGRGAVEFGSEAVVGVESS